MKKPEHFCSRNSIFSWQVTKKAVSFRSRDIESTGKLTVIFREFATKIHGLCRDVYDTAKVLIF